MIGFDAARGAVPVIAIERDDDARAMQFLRNLRRGDADHASVPAVASDHGDVRLSLRINGRFKLR